MSDEVPTDAVISDASVAPVTDAEKAQIVPPVASGPRKFHLSHNGHAMTIEADDENTARAKFNDVRGVWPNPREVTATEAE